MMMMTVDNWKRKKNRNGTIFVSSSSSSWNNTILWNKDKKKKIFTICGTKIDAHTKKILKYWNFY